MRDRAWTLILWDIENVPIPNELRNPAGVKQLKELLKNQYGKARQHQLYCMKLACRWPDHRSPYADLLGLLTTLGDVEALGYQWQGQRDKTHNADRLLKQAADRFMHMLEDHEGPEHLVVFITSDQDFGEKITELQRRNFRVVVLYHEPIASQRPVSIINAADEAYDWLPFLQQQLKTPCLGISDYDAGTFEPRPPASQQAPQVASGDCLQDTSKVSLNSAASDKGCKDGSADIPGSSKDEGADLWKTMTVASSKHSIRTAAGAETEKRLTFEYDELLEAIQECHSSDTDQLICVVAESCLVRGCSIDNSHLRLSPVSVCQIGSDVKAKMPHIDKLLAKLDTQNCNFKLIPGPKGTQPAVLLSLETIIREPHQSQKIKKIIAKMQISQHHPQSMGLPFLKIIAKTAVSNAAHGAKATCANIQPHEMVAELKRQMGGMLDSEDERVTIKAVATACLMQGLKSNTNKLVLLPVLMSQVGAGFLAVTGSTFAGKLQKTLEQPPYQDYFTLVQGPGEVAVLPKLRDLVPSWGPKKALLAQIKVIHKHPKA